MEWKMFWSRCILVMLALDSIWGQAPTTYNVSVLFLLLLFKKAGIKVALVDRNQEASKPGGSGQLRGQSMGLEKLVGTVLAEENDAIRH
jgi:hypothetical protein